MTALLGRWRITALEGFDSGYADMLGPAFIQLDDDGGQMAFGVVQLSLQWSCSANVLHFDFHGSDEGTEVWCEGDGEIEDGDDMTYRARCWPVSGPGQMASSG